MGVPPGSLWLVLPIRTVWTHDYGLEAWSRPVVHPEIGEKHSDLDYLPPGSIITVGETVPGLDRRVSKSYIEYVRVLLPTRCYVNRTHFNEGSSRLKRIA